MNWSKDDCNINYGINYGTILILSEQSTEDGHYAQNDWHDSIENGSIYKLDMSHTFKKKKSLQSANVGDILNGERIFADCRRHHSVSHCCYIVIWQTINLSARVQTLLLLLLLL